MLMPWLDELVALSIQGRPVGNFYSDAGVMVLHRGRDRAVRQDNTDPHFLNAAGPDMSGRASSSEICPVAARGTESRRVVESSP